MNTFDIVVNYILNDRRVFFCTDYNNPTKLDNQIIINKQISGNIYGIHNVFRKLNSTDIVIYMNTEYIDVHNFDLNKFIDIYLSIGKKIVFGAEKMCSPDGDKKDLYKIQNVPFPYLNSGFFIGKAGVIKKYLNTYNGEKINDQKWWTAIYLDHQDEIALDSKALMCLQTWDTDQKYYKIQDNKFTYTETNTNPNFVHANGYLKDKLNI